MLAVSSVLSSSSLSLMGVLSPNAQLSFWRQEKLTWFVDQNLLLFETVMTMLVFCREVYFQSPIHLKATFSWIKIHQPQSKWLTTFRNCSPTLVHGKLMRLPHNMQVWERIYFRWTLSWVNVSTPTRGIDEVGLDLNWQQSSSALPIFCYVLLTVAPSRLVFLSAFS